MTRYWSKLVDDLDPALLDVDQVLRLERVRLVVGKGPVGLAVEGDHRGPDPLEQVHRHGRIRKFQVFDGFIWYHLHDPVQYLVTFHQSLTAEGEIDQAEYLHLVEGEHPLLELRELAQGIDTSNQGPHGGAGQGGDLESLLLQFLDGPDVGDAAGATPGQDQHELRILLGRFSGRAGGTEGAQEDENSENPRSMVFQTTGYRPCAGVVNWKP
mgnify:CR=1 FL=1